VERRAAREHAVSVARTKEMRTRRSAATIPVWPTTIPRRRKATTPKMVQLQRTHTPRDDAACGRVAWLSSSSLPRRISSVPSRELLE
jgi:hypothetical protein